MAVESISKPKKQGWKFGLHKGQIWMSDDFDEELGGEFWFGEDEIL